MQTKYPIIYKLFIRKIKAPAPPAVNAVSTATPLALEAAAIDEEAAVSSLDYQLTIDGNKVII